MAEAREKVAQTLGDFHRTFDTDSGRKVLEYLSWKCMEGQTTAALSPESVEKTYFNEGKRAVILMIRDILNTKME